MKAIFAGPRAERGNAAIEFGLISSALMLLLIGLTDYASAITKAVDLREAARAGVQYAVRNWTDTAGITSIVKSSTKLDPNSLTVTTVEFCECPNGTSVACGGTCLGGTKRRFVRVTVSHPHQTFISYPSVIIPSTLTGVATLRIT